MENKEEHEKTVELPSTTDQSVEFPPAATWYRTNATASRDDMWAYLALQAIVVVKPKVINTIVSVPQLQVQVEGEGGKTEDADRVWPEFTVFGYQRENYNCLSFCQSPWDFVPVKGAPLVTADKEGYVRLWNVNTGQCIMYHDVHREDNKSVSISCMDWSVRNPALIYSIDEEGTLVMWNLRKGKFKVNSFGKIQPSSLHASPHQDNIIVFGSKGGNIFIAEVEATGKAGAKILHKVRHEEEVVATLWCPKLDWQSTQNESKGYGAGPVLASSVQSVKSPTIRLWSSKAEDRGMYQVWAKDRQAGGKIFRNFSPLLWAIDPNSGSSMLLTSSKTGSILAYCKNALASEVVHDIHNHSTIFGLVQCGDILWSTSYEPVIVGWNLRTASASCVIPCFRGICAIVPSPSVGNMIGIGGTDYCIRVANFTEDYPRRNCLQAPKLSLRMRSKIMALAWHPERDNVLGFGTDDGVLGYFEVRENGKQCIQFDRRVGGCVYAVDWGPFIEKEQVLSEAKKEHEKISLVLYACGAYKVYMIHTSKASNPLVDVSKIIDKRNPQSSRFSGVDPSSITIAGKASDIRWSPDFKIFAVGYNDGRVELYSPPFLQLKCWIKCHSRAIQYLSWRPYDFVQKDVTADHKHRWFVTASNDSTTRLFNLNHVFEENSLSPSDENQKPKLIISSALTIRSPSGERIISVAWSPHDPNLLVTVSYDKTAVVWNISDGSPVSRYFGHGQRLVACAFHPLHKYKLITGSDEQVNDCSLHVWDYRQHPYTDDFPSTPKVEWVQPLHVQTKEQISRDVKEEEQREVDAAVEMPTKIISGADRLHVNDTSVAAALGLGQRGKTGAASKKKSKNKSKATKSLIPATANVFINTKLQLEKEVRYLVEAEQDGSTNGHAAVGPNAATRPVSENGEGNEADSSDDEDGYAEKNDLSMIHLGLLGDYEENANLVKAECESHLAKQEWEKACALATWIGEAKIVEKVIEQGYVTETIIQYAKPLSLQLYNRACEQFADKLVLDEEIGKAATYLVLAKKYEKAVKLLADHKLFRDAMALTKAKLSASKYDPFRLEITKLWLRQLIQDGNFEVAAKVYCSIGMYGDALAVVEKRDTPYAWQTGLYLASKCNDIKKLELLGLKYSVDCMTKGNHAEAKKIMNEYKELKWLLILVTTHEGIFNLANKLRDISNSPGSAELLPADCNLKDVMSKGREVDLNKLQASEVVEKLKQTVLVELAQNQADAEVILIRTLVLKILGDPELTDAVVEESLKVADTWLGKAPYLRSAFVKAFENISN